MCDTTGVENNIDWICAKTMLNTDGIRRIKAICDDFGFSEAVPLLENIAKKQDALINEMRKHTSQIFEYELANKPNILERYEEARAQEKGYCPECDTPCVQCNPGDFYPTTD